jgi:hypothetical protein
MSFSRYSANSLFFFLLFRCGLHAQAAPEVSSSANAHPPAANAPIVLPLEYVNRHLYTTLSDEKLGSLTLLVDTGAEHTAISSEAAKNGDIHKSFWKTTISIKGYGNTPAKHPYRTVMVALRSGQTSVFSDSALVLDLGEFGKRLERPVDGILGWDFFERWCTTLDFAAKHLILRGISECAPPSGKHGTLKGEWSTHGLLLSSVLAFPNGRSAPALLKVDTGSADTLLLNTQFRTVAGLGESESADTEATSWGMNGSYGGDIVPISSIDFEGGKVQLVSEEKTTIEIARRGCFNNAYWWKDGIGQAKRSRDGGIGNELLKLLTWTFDPAAKRIYVEDATPISPPNTP